MAPPKRPTRVLRWRAALSDPSNEVDERRVLVSGGIVAVHDHMHAEAVACLGVDPVDRMSDFPELLVGDRAEFDQASQDTGDVFEGLV